ncbi:uncharacterized protein BP5553_03871 [Venustampulla echinocandica]|uniref:Deubiquitinating enzyme PH domain-containing protein n=1 Tax=Venustampulla echinocandica TaxID=2656787 RepID=A0A370TVH8_9HELO|nr:uncharacterized protein BP5553_03871 [Venustampulla echinocandica]RDL39531.1 hypothetical protein BP5553_03871 [Venustampulla echinocandica]
MEWQMQIARGEGLYGRRCTSPLAPEKPKPGLQVQGNQLGSTSRDTSLSREDELRREARSKERQAQEQELAAALEKDKKALEARKMLNDARFGERLRALEKPVHENSTTTTDKIKTEHERDILRRQSIYRSKMDKQYEALQKKLKLVRAGIEPQKLLEDQDLQNLEAKLEEEYKTKLMELRTLWENEDLAAKEGQHESLQKTREPSNLQSRHPVSAKLENPLHARRLNSQQPSSSTSPSALPFRGVLSGHIEKGTTGEYTLKSLVAKENAPPTSGAPKESFVQLSKNDLLNLKRRERQLGTEPFSTYLLSDACYSSLSRQPIPPSAEWYRDPRNHLKWNSSIKDLKDIICQGLAISPAGFDDLHIRLVQSGKSFGFGLDPSPQLVVEQVHLCAEHNAIRVLKSNDFRFVDTKWFDDTLRALLFQIRIQAIRLDRVYPIKQVQYYEKDGSLFIWNSDSSEMKLHLKYQDCFKLFTQDKKLAKQFEYCFLRPRHVEKFFYNPTNNIAYFRRPIEGGKGNNNLWLEFDTAETLKAFVEVYTKGWPEQIALSRDFLFFPR